MKKHIITLVIALGFGLNLSAQSDGFFTSTYNNYEQNREISPENPMGLTPAMPGHAYTTNQGAPLGSGLLLLGGLALAYGIRKKNS